jgi:hypothetical protein
LEIAEKREEEGVEQLVEQAKKSPRQSAGKKSEWEMSGVNAGSIV